MPTEDEMIEGLHRLMHKRGIPEFTNEDSKAALRFLSPLLTGQVAERCAELAERRVGTGSGQFIADLIRREFPPQDKTP